MLAELQQKKLRSTVTTERRRRVRLDPDTGEQAVETYLMRIDVRTGEELGEVAQEAGKSEEKEYDGHLKRFRGFDAGAGRWSAVDAPPLDEAPPMRDVAELSLVIYNVWFGPRTVEEASRFGISEVPEPLESRRRRTTLLVAQLRQEEPDIVCLQEVQEGDKFLDILLEDDWIRGKYRVAHSVRGAQIAYGLAALICHEKFPLATSCRVHDFAGFTVHNRIAMLLELQLCSGGNLLLANTHLDSLAESKNRMAQLQYIVKELAKAEDSDLLIVGDMNMTEASEEHAWFSAQEHRFRDLGAESGPTMPMDDHTGQPERIDRVFHRPKRLQLLSPVRVLGQDIVDRAARPSDHFGLSVKFGL